MGKIFFGGGTTAMCGGFDHQLGNALGLVVKRERVMSFSPSNRFFFPDFGGEEASIA